MWAPKEREHFSNDNKPCDLWNDTVPHSYPTELTNISSSRQRVSFLKFSTSIILVVPPHRNICSEFGMLQKASMRAGVSKRILKNVRDCFLTGGQEEKAQTKALGGRYSWWSKMLRRVRGPHHSLGRRTFPSLHPLGMFSLDETTR